MKFRIDLLIEMGDDVKWLEIETEEGTNGAFLYCCKSENNCFDTWHKTIEDAFSSAKEQYNVNKDDWILIKL